MHREDDIVEQIRAAFADTPLPHADALFNNHCCECAEVSSAYAGKRWADISLEDVLAGRETALLTATAWRYYLPALMIWCIRAPQTVDVIQDNLVYQLEPPTADRGVPQWFEERAVGFTADQRRAIVAYLEWYRDQDEINWTRHGVEPPRHVHNALNYWTPRTTDRS